MKKSIFPEDSGGCKTAAELQHNSEIFGISCCQGVLVATSFCNVFGRSGRWQGLGHGEHVQVVASGGSASAMWEKIQAGTKMGPRSKIWEDGRKWTSAHDRNGDRKAPKNLGKMENDPEPHLLAISGPFYPEFQPCAHFLFYTRPPDSEASHDLQ